MKLDKSIIEELQVLPGEKARLAKRPTRDGLGKAGKKGGKKAVARAELHSYIEELEVAQELLYATATHAILMIVQGLDASGKDGTIKHVFSGVNPQGCEVTSFKQPSSIELRHDYLWRAARALPEKGRIGIFNRSHYEDVLVTRVHPDLLGQDAPRGKRKVPKSFWQQRYEDINAFERHLDRNGTKVVKFFLHHSADEQKRRFLERLDDPSKHWKFSASDLAERAYWDDYQQAYEEAITATSTEWAPWYVMPADDKPTCRAHVAGILVHTIEQLRLKTPQVSDEQLERINEARTQLLEE